MMVSVATHTHDDKRDDVNFLLSVMMTMVMFCHGKKEGGGGGGGGDDHIKTILQPDICIL